LTDSAPNRVALIVDDDPAYRYALSHAIRSLGWQAHEVGDGVRAVEDCRTFNPLVIFIDLSMPGLDGFQTCAKMRAGPACRAALIVGMSSLPTHAVEDRALRSGFDMYLPKPIGTNLLNGILGGAMRH
jgi:CheY-like chemotaxis protein